MRMLFPIMILFLALAKKPTELVSVKNSSEAKTEDTLYWSKDYKLTRADFYADEPRRTPYAGFSYTIILLDYEVESLKTNRIVPKFSIKAAFNRRKSWISPSSLASPDRVLKHEQLHFDISELTARRLKSKLLKKSYTSNFRKEINEIYKEEINKGEKMQASYDQETDHGLIYKKQEQWEVKIQALLEKES